MWNKIFRNKSNKIKSGDCANGSASANHVASPNKSKLSKVVNSFSLKRTAKDGSARNVDKCDITFSDLTICRFILEQDHSSEFAAPAEPVEVSLSLEPCPICTRTFAPKTLAKHIVICERAAMKKRKKFDSSKQRREGTDLADFLPKNFGLPPSKQEPKTPPKAAQQASTPILPKKQPEPVKATYLQQKKPATQASPSIAVLKEKPKAAINRLLPPSEQCPYCERCFGIKAYDRHVEWCKEKTRIANPHQKSSVSVAKERLQARTKYRAPCLKTKRGANREKYSGLSCGDSTNSLSDGGSVGSGWKTKASSEEQKVNMSTSLCSSIMSDGGMFDKYDPFLSAKRQLEELCSSTSINTPSTPSSYTPNTKTRLTSSMSSSYTANSRTTPSNVKSNFHRTLSLRVPRKTTPSRSLFTPTPKPKPTIQRGISDEGPISSKFLKPEEYDEMPVKSVCVNDFAVNRHPETHSTPKVIKRDSTTNRNRRNLKLNFRNTDDRGISNPLSKTDSLAVFLQYENATRVTDIPIKLTEKDLKDKSNILSKQTSLKSSATDLDCILSDKDKLSSLKNSLTNLLECHNALADSPKVVDPYNFSSINKTHPIKLEPLPKMQSTKPNSSQGPSFPLSHSLKENDFIDPKLINVCDNLSMSVTKLSDSDLTSSSTDSMERTKTQLESQDHGLGIPKLSPLQQPISNRNSTEKRNLLKRQLRLGKNQFLYDMSPENDPFGIECENTALIDIDSNKLHSSTSTIEPVLDEFDIEEFLSSFDDAEEYPLFKDYKEFLSNRSLNKLSNNSQNSIRSPTLESPILNDEGDNEEKNEIFSSNESFLKHESESVPYVASERSNTEFRSPTMDTNDNVIRSPELYQTSCRSADDEDELPASDINQNNVRNSSERELERVSSTNFEPSCDSATMMYPDDLDKLSSVESLTIRKCTSSKQSGDSAYGSLSRHSPVDRGTRRTTSTISRNLSSAPSDHMYPTKSKILHKLDHKRRSRDLSVSSSSSEASLPNLHYPSEQLDKGHHRDGGDIQSKKDSRMSKFCHECGSKFLVTQAKFCMECGVKRIALD